MQSTAPSSIARIVAVAPRAVRLETITTGNGLQPHHLLEELEPVHLRHLDVEGHDVGIERLDRLARLQRIGGLADHLDAGIVGERSRDQAAHRGRIVDDEHPDRVHAPSPSLSR